MLASVRPLTPAVSLGSDDILIEHPAGLIHRVVDPVALASSTLGPGLLRVSLGIEDVDDAWADLDRTIDVATGCRAAAAGGGGGTRRRGGALPGPPGPR